MIYITDSRVLQNIYGVMTYVRTLFFPLLSLLKLCESTRITNNTEGLVIVGYVRSIKMKRTAKRGGYSCEFERNTSSGSQVIFPVESGKVLAAGKSSQLKHVLHE